MKKGKRILKTLLGFSIPAIICLSPISAQAGILDEIGEVLSEETTQSETYETQEQEESQEERKLYEGFDKPGNILGDLIACRSRPVYLRLNGIANADIGKIVETKWIVSHRQKGDYTELYLRLFSDENKWNENIKWNENFSYFDPQLTRFYLLTEGEIVAIGRRGFYRDFYSKLQRETLFRTEKTTLEEELGELGEDIIKEVGRKLTVTDLLEELCRIKNLLLAKDFRNLERVVQHYEFENIMNVGEIPFSSGLAQHYTAWEVKAYISSKEDCKCYLIGVGGIRDTRPGPNLIGSTGIIIEEFTLPGN